MLPKSDWNGVEWYREALSRGSAKLRLCTAEMCEGRDVSRGFYGHSSTLSSITKLIEPQNVHIAKQIMNYAIPSHWRAIQRFGLTLSCETLKSLINTVVLYFRTTTAILQSARNPSLEKLPINYRAKAFRTLYQLRVPNIGVPPPMMCQWQRAMRLRVPSQEEEGGDDLHWGSDFP